jgi:alpha-glucosidase
MYIRLRLLSNLLIICSLTVSPVNAQKNIRLSSPDGAITFSFGFRSSKMEYSISYKGKPVVNKSSLSLAFADNAFSGDLRINKPAYREATESYELIVGKSKTVNDCYKEVAIPVQENSLPHRMINLVVRAFNDGIAFRYEFPQQQNWSSYELKNEHTTFKLAVDPVVHALLLPGYTTSHEGLYTSLPLSEITEDTLMDMPALFEFPGHIYMAITEAALVDYAGMYITKHNGIVTSKLSPLTNQSHNPPLGDGGIKVKATLPHKTPWRVLMISDRVGALIESNIITSLNEPNKIKDAGWIKPGKTTFPWWNGNVLPDTINAPGNNFVTQQYYIDFCARNNIEYHSVVEYGLHQWYTDDGVGFQPGPNPDVTKPVPGLDMKEVCDYAKSKGVAVRVWVHWAALYPKLDSAFAIFQRWGLSGMMIDFMDRDDQEMVNIQTEMLQKAAKYHLHIQFHGAYKPTGLHRTYPNEFTREGTLNYEVNKWDKLINADHDINIPFTRMLAGATDYHLGGFRAVPDSLFKVQYTRPLMMSTRCHMLAMYVVLESYLGMVCDYPAAYEGQPGFEFIKQVPATWDKTKVLNAEVGRYIVIARKKNNDWYIGGITNHKERELEIPLNFLDEGNYAAEIYTDAKDVNINPNNLVKEIKNITNTDNVKVQLASSGGIAITIKKK